MNPFASKEGIELEIHIEELEPKIAPDGGETVVPLGGGGGGTTGGASIWPGSPTTSGPLGH